MEPHISLAMLNAEKIGMEARKPVTMALVRGRRLRQAWWAWRSSSMTQKMGLTGCGAMQRARRVKQCWVSGQDSDEPAAGKFRDKMFPWGVCGTSSGEQSRLLSKSYELG